MYNFVSFIFANVFSTNYVNTTKSLMTYFINRFKVCFGKDFFLHPLVIRIYVIQKVLSC